MVLPVAPRSPVSRRHHGGRPHRSNGHPRPVEGIRGPTPAPTDAQPRAPSAIPAEERQPRVEPGPAAEHVASTAILTPPAAIDADSGVDRAVRDPGAVPMR